MIDAVFLPSSDVYHTRAGRCRYVLFHDPGLAGEHYAGGEIEEAEKLWRGEDQDPRRECEECRDLRVSRVAPGVQE